MEKFDYIVVGGGSSGCVLASRLSEDPATRVLLVEAGPDTPPYDVPESIYAEGYLPDYFSEIRYWTDLTVYRDPTGNRAPSQVEAELAAHRYEQARVMGGGSSVNGQVALRGIPSDYDGWAAGGAYGWTYDECLPYFRRLERDMDFAGSEHGQDGPIAIQRTLPEDWAGFALAFREAMGERGLAYADDCHAVHRDGCFPFPKNNVYGRRVSTAVGYLTSVVRRRPNLKIVSDTLVERILFEGSAACGVETARRGGGPSAVYRAGEVILCAGALHSPAMLMRAGIGPGEHLSETGIAVRSDLPGVGQNLQDHPLVGIGVHLKPEARLNSKMLNSFLVYGRFTSGLDGCPRGDMKISLGNRFDQTPIGHQIGVVRVGPDKALSRGEVRLKSDRPSQEPYVSFNLLSDPRDLARMKLGIRFAIGLLQSPAIAAASYSVFAGAYTDWIRRLSRKTVLNRIITKSGALALDSHAVIRKLIMGMAASGYDIERMKTDDLELERFIRDTVLGNWHACGTVAMGSRGNRMACVDPEGRVFGVDRLRVADASVMPSIPCANINLTTIMIAEKLSDAVRGRFAGAKR